MVDISGYPRERSSRRLPRRDRRPARMAKRRGSWRVQTRNHPGTTCSLFDRSRQEARALGDMAPNAFDTPLILLAPTHRGRAFSSATGDPVTRNACNLD
jgi:hypothetical protein